MTAEDFGAELQRRRKLKRWSRATLGERSGVSESSISNYEVGRQGRFQQPGRHTIVDLVRPFGDWDIDEALAMVGEPPLTADERAVLLDTGPAPHREGVSLADLARYWDGIPEREREALLILAAAAAGSYPMSEPEVRERTVDGATVFEEVPESDRLRR